ncbi:MAG TPA: helix-turn-helix domain-containing protein [Candidatus Onthomonas avicola]|nr:helix-turn-helix domain-containing protein [Candidatus Onthomonas avicola]
MDPEMLRFLQRQEEEEGMLYQSASAIAACIDGDFSNGGELLRALGARQADLARLFQAASLVPFAGSWPVPVRTCDRFQIHKHTLRQLPYLHRHDFYELVYVLRGRCGQTAGTPGRPLTLRARQACLIPPGICHIMERCGPGDLIVKCSIPPQLYREAAGPDTQGEGISVYTGSAAAELLLALLLRESRGRRAHAGTVIRNHLSSLLIELARSPEQPAPALLEELTAYLESSPREASLRRFAAQIGYSEDHAGRLLREEAGKSFQALALEWKLRRAARLLAETDAPIASIAGELGYANPSGLYKQFSRAYGMTPRAYRACCGERAVPGDRARG